MTIKECEKAKANYEVSNAKALRLGGEI